MVASYRKHGFTLCLLAVVLLALFYPEPVAEGGWLRPEWATKFGVWVIFFLLGVSMPGRQLAVGYKPLRLQVFVLTWNYLLFPSVTILCLLGLGRFLPHSLALGFGLLSVLPTTIASAVLFTGLAGGRTPSALCATVLSNVCAVVVVPLWVALYFKTGGSVDLPLVPLLGKLSFLVVFPILIGQLLRISIKPLADRVVPWVRSISSGIILFIVYVAFAGSFAVGFLKNLSLAGLLGLVVGTTGLLLLISFLVWQSANWLRFKGEERSAAFFCASQKSLATGLPLATAIFAVLPDSLAVNTGMLLLPLIVYHPLQLVLAAFWAERCAATSAL